MGRVWKSPNKEGNNKREKDATTYTTSDLTATQTSVGHTQTLYHVTFFTSL